MSQRLEIRFYISYRRDQISFIMQITILYILTSVCWAVNNVEIAS